MKFCRTRGTRSFVLLHETFRFFGVTSVDAWRNVWDCPKVAARRSTFFESSPGPTATWLRLGELQARETDCEPYDKERFSDNLRAIRQLTVQSPEEFLPEMQRLCSEAGVALSLVPEIKKAPWSGAAMWLTPAKAMIVLNLRGKFEDRFWFTFFHEAGHILLGSKKATFIDDGKTCADDPEEKKADDFAAKTLIPLEFDSQIKAARSAAHIEKLAAGLGISPGIVAGRYQHLTKKWNHSTSSSGALSGWRRHRGRPSDRSGTRQWCFTRGATRHRVPRLPSVLVRCQHCRYPQENGV